MPAEIPALWEKIEPYVHDANRFGGGKFAAHDWLARLLVEAAWLYVSPTLESAVICEVQTYPRAKVFTIVLLGGEGGHDWDQYQSVFETAAGRCGCDQIEIFGRPGWKNILKAQGYELAHHVWRKEPKDGRFR